MTNNKLRSLTESSLLTALSVIIGAAGLYIPFVILFWTLPVTIVTARHGLKYGTLSIFISAMLLCLFLTPVTAMPLAVSSAPLALTLGYGFYRGWSAVRNFTASFGASAAGTVLFLAITFYMTGINLFTDQIDAIKSAMLDTNAMFSSMGVTSEAMIDAEKQTNHIVEVMILLMPMMFILNALLKLVINYMASSMLLRRLGSSEISSLPPFTQWHFPKLFIYIYILALIGMYWGDTRSIQMLYQVSLNIYLLAGVIGLVQGLSVIRFFYKVKHWPAAIWIFIIVMLCVNLIVSQMIAIAGFFDMIFNYRSRYQARGE